MPWLRSSLIAFTKHLSKYLRSKKSIISHVLNPQQHSGITCLKSMLTGNAFREFNWKNSQSKRGVSYPNRSKTLLYAQPFLGGGRSVGPLVCLPLILSVGVDRNFQERVIDHGIYPHDYVYPDGRIPSKPINWNDITERLTLSPNLW